MKKAFVIAMLLVSIQLQAQMRIGANEALTTAESFITQNTKQGEATLTLSEEIKSHLTGQTNLFVFSVEPKGFVIVSAMDEVLAYSLRSDLPKIENMPEHIAYWIHHFNDRTEYLVEHPDEKPKAAKTNREVAPLLTSVWGQGCFHNEACPLDSVGPCGHVSAGCVAVAMAQILYYHKYPMKGFGELTYDCPPYGTLSANFGETMYDWNGMCDTLHEGNPAVAQLISHCGIAVMMNYGAHQSNSSFTAANNAFRQCFGFPTATLIYRSYYDDETWQEIIKRELDKQLPVYFRGMSSLGGHAFICDGYDTNGLFHFNFGWDGVADGFYTLDNPSGFTSQQAIIHNILPIGNIPIHCDEHNIIYVSPNGTGDGSSWSNSTNDLQGALFKSHFDNCTIWVKEGTYKGDSINEYAFWLMGNSKLHGGFKGDEPFDYDLSLRDFESHPSILDGNHRQGVISVLPSIDSDSIVIDGFTIQNGISKEGAGMSLSSHATVSNCKICHNSAVQNGGGISSSLNSIDIQFVDCVFFDNQAKNGGAIHDIGSTTFIRCNIHDNIASHNGGGIHSIGNTTPSQFINCTISHNSALNGGGAYCNRSKSSYWSCLFSNNTATNAGACHGESNLINCTIVKNEGSENYGGVYHSEAVPHEIRNCIIWGNVSQGEYEQIGPGMNHDHCAVQDDSSTSSANIKLAAENDGESPECHVRFIDADIDAGGEGHGGDWRLQSHSVCIDRGVGIAQQPDTDLAGNPRIKHLSPDMGAYESNTVSHTIDLDFCENSPYYYDSIFIPQAGTYTFLYPGPQYDSLVILNMTLLIESPPVTDTICEGEAYDFHGTLLYETGVYFDTIDCIGYRLNLTVKPVTDIYIEKNICEGDSINFFGTHLAESGHYYKEFYCTKRYYLDLKVNPRPSLQCTNDTTVFIGQPITLSASGADTYLWSTGDTTASIVLYPEKDNYYSVTGTMVNGCNATKQIMVKVEGDLNDDMFMFPNPANDIVNIYKKNIDEVLIFNTLGQPLKHISGQRKNLALDVSKFEDGVYIVMVRALNNRYYAKLIVQH